MQLGAGGTFLVVPSGKLGVIEHRSTLLGQTKVSGYFITSTIGGGVRLQRGPDSDARRRGDVVIGSHPLRAFAAADTQYGAVVRRSDTAGNVMASLVVSGFSTQP